MIIIIIIVHCTPLSCAETVQCPKIQCTVFSFKSENFTFWIAYYSYIILLISLLSISCPCIPAFQVLDAKVCFQLTDTDHTNKYSIIIDNNSLQTIDDLIIPNKLLQTRHGNWLTYRFEGGHVTL